MTDDELDEIRAAAAAAEAAAPPPTPAQLETLRNLTRTALRSLTAER